MPLVAPATRWRTPATTASADGKTASEAPACAVDAGVVSGIAAVDVGGSNPPSLLAGAALSTLTSAGVAAALTGFTTVLAGVLEESDFVASGFAASAFAASSTIAAAFVASSLVGSAFV